MREPHKIVAALEIAAALRSQLASQIEQHQSTGWDDDVLTIELGSVLGTLMRGLDAPPSAVERLVHSLRAVHAGLRNSNPTSAEDAVRELCPECAVDATTGDALQDGQQVQ